MDNEERIRKWRETRAGLLTSAAPRRAPPADQSSEQSPEQPQQPPATAAPVREPARAPARAPASQPDTVADARRVIPAAASRPDPAPDAARGTTADVAAPAPARSARPTAERLAASAGAASAAAAIPTRRQEELADAARQRDELADSRLPDDAAVIARIADDQAQRWWQHRLWRQRAMLFLGLPLLLALVYGLILRPAEYRSSTSFVVMQASGSGDIGPTAGLLGLVSGAGLGDAFRIREYLLSREAMAEMEQRTGFLDHFRSGTRSPFARPHDLPALGIDPHGFYRRAVHVGIDMREGIIRLDVDALTPEDSRRFAEALLALANEWIARVADLPNQDQAQALQSDVEQAQADMRAASLALAEVQHRRRELDPEKTGAVIYQLITSLEVKLAERLAEKDAILSNGLSESPLLVRLDAEIAALRRQIDTQRQRLVGGADSQSLTSAAIDLTEASTRLGFSQAALEASLGTAGHARLASIRDRRYLVVVARPVAAISMRIPVLLNLAGLALVLGFIAWGVAGLLRSGLFLGGGRG